MEAGVDFLTVVEHRLIPARVRNEWAKLKGKGFALSGLPPANIPLMMVMLVLGLLA